MTATNAAAIDTDTASAGALEPTLDERLTRLEARLTAPDAARVRAALDASASANTRRAYRQGWAAWETWANSRDTDSLPAAPEAVAAYLADRASAGAKVSTVRAAASAIAAAHRAAGQPNPCDTEGVKRVLKGIARQAADSGSAGQRQAEALLPSVVAAVRATAPDTDAGRVDVALCSLLGVAGLRRSEAAALTWGDIAAEADGSGRLTVRRSKTDQEAEGAIVAVTRQAMADLDAIRDGADDAAPVFGLSDSQIHRRIQAAASRAGFDGRKFGGHSGRVALAVSMTRRGAPAAAVMRQGRWSTTRMVARYTRNEQAAEALQYLEGDC